ncbi:sugar transferase [Planctobacterium marinum]|uniref:Glycosyl transferase n=1 Tax=Planctobacterium marinum TaxID=1631968 RepID=A0AA48I808_9ALTE|nr:glycosyl transferase [Planctobacterium marinum]
MIQKMIAFAILMVLMPVLLIVPIAIILTDGFPVFFKQRRIGFQGKAFDIYKFRTMTNVAGAEKGSFDAGCVTRVTKVGKVLRKTKLDELPQIINVLNGSMNFVGPRPEVEKWVGVYPSEWKKVHQMKPGITDPASIEFRNEEEILNSSSDPEATYKDDILPRKLGMYLNYIKHKSLLVDTKIILRTFYSVIVK